MGNTFSCLTRCVQSLTDELVPQVNENIDTQQNVSENCIRAQESVCCSNSELNSEDNNGNQIVKGKPAVKSANSATYNLQIQIRDPTGSVMIGSNNNIDFHRSGQHMRSISEVDAPPMDMASRTTAPVDEETQILTKTPITYNITANNVIVGDSNEIKVPPSSDRESNFDFRMSHRRLDGAVGFDEANAKRTFERQLHSTPYRFPSPGVESQLAKAFDKMKEIVDKLYPLRDGGKWEEFDEALNEIQSKHESQPEIKCFLTFERCVRLTYQKRFVEGRKLAEDALSIVNNEFDGTLRDVLSLLGNVTLARTFRREGEEKRKLGRAFDCLEIAKQSGDRLKEINLTIPMFSLALLYYELARLWSEFAEMANNPTSAKTKASKFYGLCIDQCRELSNNNRLYIARQCFALMFLARLSVPTSSASKKPSLKKAEGYLEEFKRSHNQVGDTLIAAKIKYFMIKSTLSLLAGNGSGAEELVNQARNTAEKYGFYLEIKLAQDQIDRICAFKASEAKLQVKNISSRYACNSTSTSDSDQSASRSD
ncbi:hypothetical protein AWC38_SpisGene21937 [Stylophora pistillata]|uniref:Uncharacterized protein n=1 Tax=Stylophora pistillata TaxID=50429 RepID=A0A2B4R6G8_STYPI|nr:hypothetical protein AWC38_SpisGene21937 [Stylophora pistillata]